MPEVLLAHRNPPTTSSEPKATAGAVGSSVVSPAQTIAPGREPLTSRPWPKSTSDGQFAGLRGGDQDRCRTSQRAIPSMITQPMFPDGDLNAAGWTTGNAAPDVVELVVGVKTVAAVGVTEAVVVAAVLVAELAPVAVMTVPVLV